MVLKLSSLLKVLENYKYNILFTAPNSDDGSGEIIKIQFYVDKYQNVNLFPSWSGNVFKCIIFI